MNSMSFEQTISNGVIRLPEEAQDRFTGMVHVLVWQAGPAEAPQQPGAGLMRRLIRNPARVSGFTPLSRAECHERRS